MDVIKPTNKTGAATVKGTLVETDTTTDKAFDIADADAVDCIGAVFEAGVADGSDAWIVISGCAQVLLKDTTAATRHNWAATHDVAGRADCSQGTPPAAPAHFNEIGHCIESQAGGSDVLATCILHFN